MELQDEHKALLSKGTGLAVCDICGKTAKSGLIYPEVEGYFCLSCLNRRVYDKAKIYVQVPNKKKNGYILINRAIGQIIKFSYKPFDGVPMADTDEYIDKGAGI